MRQKQIAIAGGDIRQYYMAKSLIERGFAIFYYGLSVPEPLSGAVCCRKKEELQEKLTVCDAVVLPFFCKDREYMKREKNENQYIKAADILPYLPTGVPIFGVELTTEEAEQLSGENHFVYDLINDDTDVTLRKEWIAQEIIITILMLDLKLCRAEILSVFPGECAAGYVGQRMAEMISQILEKEKGR